MVDELGAVSLTTSDHWDAAEVGVEMGDEPAEVGLGVGAAAGEATPVEVDASGATS